jgi:hypothetical protein
MATVSDSQLNVLLAAAIKNYSDGWQNVDEELYGLCRKRPSQATRADVFTKVAIIGRVYEAGIPRSFQAPGDNEMTVVHGLTEQADLIRDGLQALGGSAFNRQSAGALIELHGRITRKLAEHTADAWLSSFVSKYLHFHCPIVPIYDSNASGSVGRFVDRSTITDVRNWMTTLPGWATAYRNFVAAFVVLYERAWTVTPLQPTVKHVDHLLWRKHG